MTQHVTIERTKKKYKLLLSTSWALFFGGLYIGVGLGNADIGAQLFCAGIALWFVTRGMIWWDHA